MKRDNVPEDLLALEAKICKIRQAGKDKVKEKTSGNYSAAKVGLQVATDLLAAIAVGGAIGYVLDRMCGTEPMMLVIFLLFGGAAGFLNVYRLVKNIEK